MPRQFARTIESSTRPSLHTCEILRYSLVITPTTKGPIKPGMVPRVFVIPMSVPNRRILTSDRFSHLLNSYRRSLKQYPDAKSMNHTTVNQEIRRPMYREQPQQHDCTPHNQFQVEIHMFRPSLEKNYSGKYSSNETRVDVLPMIVCIFRRAVREMSLRSRIRSTTYPPATVKISCAT